MKRPPWLDDTIAPDGNAVRENFDRWFKGSVIVDKRGRPLVAYHRTATDFDEFDTTRGDLGTHFGTADQAANLFGGQLRNGERTLAVFLHIENPLRLQDKGGFHADGVAPQLRRKGFIDGATCRRLVEVGLNGRVHERRAANEEIKALLRAAGHDGVVYRNTMEGRGNSFIAFDPCQIKSAIGNSGLYLAASGSITDQQAALALRQAQQARAVTRTLTRGKALA